MTHLLIHLVGLGALACLSGCPQPEVVATTPQDTVAATPKPTPKPAPATDNPDRARLEAEYRQLALKNDCSRGFRRMNGTWKFIGETRTPEYSETLAITDHHFTNRLNGKPDGKALSGTVKGEIRCLFKNRVLVTVDSVDPAGAYENNAGDAYPCDLLGDLSGFEKRMLMICYFDWDLRTAAGIEYEYERVLE